MKKLVIMVTMLILGVQSFAAFEFINKKSLKQAGYKVMETKEALILKKKTLKVNMYDTRKMGSNATKTLFFALKQAAQSLNTKVISKSKTNIFYADKVTNQILVVIMAEDTAVYTMAFPQKDYKIGEQFLTDINNALVVR